MATINLEPIERRDIITWLEYAKEQRSRENNKKKSERWDTKKYDLHRIDYLIDVINGMYHDNFMLTSKSYREKSGKIPANNNDGIDLGL